MPESGNKDPTLFSTTLFHREGKGVVALVAKFVLGYNNFVLGYNFVVDEFIVHKS